MSGARAQPAWDRLPAAERAACLDRAADLLEERRVQYLSLLVREAGKTLPDAVAELREAVDFCRYYAARGRELFGAPQNSVVPQASAIFFRCTDGGVCLYQPVELPAGDFHWSDHRCPDGRQQRCCEAGAGDALDRARHDRVAA